MVWLARVIVGGVYGWWLLVASQRDLQENGT